MQNDDPRSDLFLFLGAAFATAIGLFVLNQWYVSYFDVHYHAKLAEGGPHENAVAAREEDQKLLNGGKLPIDQAMQRLGQRGRQNIASIAPAPSDDLSALSGWIRHPAYKPVVAHPIRTARAPQPVATPNPEPTAAPPAQAPAQPAQPASTPARRKAR